MKSAPRREKQRRPSWIWELNTHRVLVAHRPVSREGALSRRIRISASRALAAPSRARAMDYIII